MTQPRSAADTAQLPENRRAFAQHPRQWAANRYVYPVVSRRSGGISVGINLNPDKVCNFDCIYCSVNRKEPPPLTHVDMAQVQAELDGLLAMVQSGEIYAHDPFDKISPQLRRLNDVAFSGDGEPTTEPLFPQCVQVTAETLAQRRLAGVKLVLITNASMFHRPVVRGALEFMDKHNGEVWAKLDAGTEAYYKLVDRSAVPLDRILANLAWCCQTRPTVIQTLLMRIHDEPPPPAEIDAYIARLAAIMASAGRIKLVQLYTVARQTTESYAAKLTADELEAIASRVRSALIGVPVAVFE
ncbi:MAG: radical SAM protein [Phycisphaerae bacterium]